MSLSDDPGSPGAVRTVSVGIAAWNAEANIGAILFAVSSQCEERVTISEIIVHSDQSTDGTIAAGRLCPDPRIRIVDHPKRRGFAASVGSLLETFKGDALLLLNDDIRIADDRFVELMAMPIFEDGVDFVGANLQPLPPRTFVERASVSVFRVWERISGSMPQRDSVFTCDGAAMCLAGRFARSIRLPGDLGLVGNVDAFLYFSCMTAGFRYVHACGAVAYYRSPSSPGDYVARNARNDSQKPLLQEQFGAVVAKAFRIRPLLYWKSVGTEVLHNPLTAAFVFIVGFYVRSVARSLARNASPTWETLKSSKQLD
jgi:glycosyltransferase involved in cell wall biosynthesis